MRNEKEDTILRSDAIKAVWGDDNNPSEDGMVFEAQSHIDRDIRLIPSADRPQRWIPCSERLPKEYEVLCFDIYKNCIVGHPFAEDSASTGFCAESEGVFLYECIAWMPLPEPWKGADDDL